MPISFCTIFWRIHQMSLAETCYVFNILNYPLPSFMIPGVTEMSMELNATTNAVETTSEDVLIEAMDSFNNDDSRLLQRPAKISTSDSQPNVTEPPPEVIAQQVAEDLSPLSEETKISIKLKFINDEQKLVSGNLKEILGDFKRQVS